MTRNILRFMVAALIVAAGTAGAEPGLTEAESLAIDRVGHGLVRTAVYDAVDGGPDRFLVLGDRFARLSVYRMSPGGERERVWFSRSLAGNVQEVVAADLDGDGTPDHLVCSTGRQLYAFDINNRFNLAYESLPTDFRAIGPFTVANVDSDPQLEIVLAADNLLFHLDGSSFRRQWSSTDNFSPVRIRAADVDGDRRVEMVLSDGQVLDGVNGRLEWQAPAAFGTNFELLDVDGDGIPEIVGESGGQPLRIWDARVRSERRVP